VHWVGYLAAWTVATMVDSSAALLAASSGYKLAAYLADRLVDWTEQRLAVQ
jgi:hypothetical protein